MDLVFNVQFCIFLAVIPFSLGLVSQFNLDADDALEASARGANSGASQSGGRLRDLGVDA